MHTVRQGREPALRLPLHGVVAPDRAVPVRGEDADGDGRVLRDGNFVDLRTVDSADGLGEREDDVFACSVKCWVDENY